MKAHAVRRRPRVMALDDSELIHAQLRLLFRTVEVDLTCTSKWLDVAETCGSDDPPDLLVLDLSMPDVRGEVVGMGVKSGRGEIPIVIYSSESEPRLQMAAASVGARAAISKAEGQKLVVEVMRILERA